MKYDVEYDSYKFSSEEVLTIIHSLISYSNDPFLDKISKKNVLDLLENINKSTKTSVAQ
jgi:hypothetical protein